MSDLLRQTKTLEDLKVIDFEQTQLLTLSVELEALSFAPILHRNVRSEARSALIWHSKRHWWQYLWLSVYPFLLWIRDFTGVVKYVLKRSRARIFGLHIDILKWIFLFILAPLLGIVSIFWNLSYYIFPSLIYALMRTSVTVAPQMFSNVNVKEALLEMQNGVEAVYSQAVAEYLCLVSAITYTRYPDSYARAEQLYRDLVAVDGHPLPAGPVLDSYPDVKHQILRLMYESETGMRTYAESIGLEVIVISELDSGQGGPTASLYVSRNHGVLIVGVSGTNPFDAREILVDAAFEKVKANPAYFDFLKDARQANLHRGFYSSLFSLSSAATYPAKRIREAILAQAKQMRAKLGIDKQVQVYVTGHSLGAATAGILASSLTNLGPDAHLCSAYVYGNPMSSDAAFCQAYDAKPTVNLWRVIDDGDIVTKIPPSVNNLSSNGGVGDMMDTNNIWDGTILDYSAIGRGIRYDRSGSYPEGLKDIKVTCNVDAHGKPASVWWMSLLQYTLLRGLVQHSPMLYSVNMRRARAALKEV